MATKSEQNISALDELYEVRKRLEGQDVKVESVSITVIINGESMTIGLPLPKAHPFKLGLDFRPTFQQGNNIDSWLITREEFTISFDYGKGIVP